MVSNTILSIKYYIMYARHIRVGFKHCQKSRSSKAGAHYACSRPQALRCTRGIRSRSKNTHTDQNNNPLRFKNDDSDSIISMAPGYLLWYFFNLTGNISDQTICIKYTQIILKKACHACHTKDMISYPINV